MRLIDADALIKWLTTETGFKTQCDDCASDDCTSIDCLDCVVEYAIKNAPTINLPQWTSVEERLPDTKGEYIVAYHPCYWDDVKSNTVVGYDSYRGGTKWAREKYQRVTHWMPFPTLSEVKQNAD